MAKHNCVVSLVGLCSRVLTHSWSGLLVLGLSWSCKQQLRLGSSDDSMGWVSTSLTATCAAFHCVHISARLTAGQSTVGSETHYRPVHSGQWLSAMGAVGSEAVTVVILEGKLPKALNAETESLNFSWEVYRLSECLKIGRITTVHCFLIWMWHWFFPWSTFI